MSTKITFYSYNLHYVKSHREKKRKKYGPASIVRTNTIVISGSCVSYSSKSTTMKIYYKIPDSIGDIEGDIDRIMKNLPTELSHVIKHTKKVTSDLFNDKLHWYFETIKYKIKWAVRHIEDEIEKEDGIIMINDKGGVDLENLSPELMEKIEKEIELRFEQ